jgi:Common central domain of tyrosinase/Polyphenol oxidase middle domain
VRDTKEETLMAVYVRRNVWGLESRAPQPPWDSYTVGYASAIAAMRNRPATDPTSWTYQAAMHGSYTTPPAGATWNQCQHGTWYFLPWHRMYLYWFERIVRKAAIAAGAPKDWALPYWNYSAGAPSNQLPPAFRLPQWTPPGGGAPQANPLHTDARNHNPDINGGAGLPTRVTSYAAAYAFVNFTGTPYPGFGGPVTGFSHDSGTFGGLENQPHNPVHVMVGGDATFTDCSRGWMADPNCAAQDPIFWLHHANIDRLWSNWLALGGGRMNPNDPRWRTFDFTFWDENGTRQQMTPNDVMDTVRQLGYIYDDRSSPAIVRARFAMLRQPQPPEPPGPPQLVAATEEPVALSGGRTDVTLELPQPARAAVATAAEGPGNGHLYLHVEGLDSDLIPGVAYEVHVNLPQDADLEAQGDDSMVGLISFFGFKRDKQATEDNPNHPIGPIGHTFDITARVQELRSSGHWDDGKVDVSFVPVGLEPPPGAAGTAHDATTEAKPSLGRVSISFHPAR